MPPSTQPLTARKTGPRNDSTCTAATLLAPTNTPSYCFCHQSHPSSGCKTVLKIGKWKKILMRSCRCFICLKKYYISKECRSAIRCRNCEGRHHTSISMKNLAEIIKPATQPSTVSQGANPTKSLYPQANTFSSTTTNSMYAGTSSEVLLQTARMLICNPNGLQSPLEVRVIFDSGSQKSYITRQAQDALPLNATYSQRMSIKTFGSEKEEQQRDCKVIKVIMKTVDGAFLELLFFTIPLICEPLNNQPINFCKAEYDHLTHLTLADSCGSGDSQLISSLAWIITGR